MNGRWWVADAPPPPGLAPLSEWSPGYVGAPRYAAPLKIPLTLVGDMLLSSHYWTREALSIYRAHLAFDDFVPYLDWGWEFANTRVPMGVSVRDGVSYSHGIASRGVELPEDAPFRLWAFPFVPGTLTGASVVLYGVPNLSGDRGLTR